MQRGERLNDKEEGEKEGEGEGKEKVKGTEGRETERTNIIFNDKI